MRRCHRGGAADLLARMARHRAPDGAVPAGARSAGRRIPEIAGVGAGIRTPAPQIHAAEEIRAPTASYAARREKGCLGKTSRATEGSRGRGCS
jgi:hypothetical protein